MGKEAEAFRRKRGELYGFSRAKVLARFADYLDNAVGIFRKEAAPSQTRAWHSVAVAFLYWPPKATASVQSNPNFIGWESSVRRAD